MASHPCILACRIPWTEEPGRLQSMDLQRLRHNRVTNAFTFAFYNGLGLGLGFRKGLPQRVHLELNQVRKED